MQNSVSKIETQYMQTYHTLGSLNKYENWITQCYGCRFFVVCGLITIMAFDISGSIVFYVSDLANKKLSIVLLTNKIIINNIDDQEDIDAEDDPFLGYHCRMRADQ
ncbi:hypothetical protein Lal_00030395 [Lupinus albus]|nr:hypothetical protein Lal_00030395 [Lupinus albus]